MFLLDLFTDEQGQSTDLPLNVNRSVNNLQGSVYG